MSLNMDASSIRYFVVKSATVESLDKASHTNQWACTDRKLGAQPNIFLSEAFKSGSVILIYSVSSAGGWHGYALMKSPPELKDKSYDNQMDEAENIGLQQKKSFADQYGDNLYYFDIEWKTLYLKGFGNCCLRFTHTRQLGGDDPVNKARNFQEIPPECGQEMCKLIDKDYSERLDHKIKSQQLSQGVATPFINVAEEKDTSVIWSILVKKVEQMGKIILACVFGSQRYNLHTVNSDVDMFVVYQADTTAVLGFNPPERTIKNREHESCDYTVYEVHRYCELLRAGDHHCVETLFLNHASVLHAADEWHTLTKHARLFLNRNCLEKYVRDAKGSKGIRYLDKLQQSGEALQEPMTPKICKLFYIVIRLLQNAREVALQLDLQVYRHDTSSERALLLGVRQGNYSHSELRTIIDELLKDIEDSDMKNDGKDLSQEADIILEDWIIELRFKNFESCMAIKHGVSASKPV